MTFITGFQSGFSYLAIGAQNAFVLKQGLIRQNVFLVCLIVGVRCNPLPLESLAREIITEYPMIESLARIAGALFLFTYGVLNLYSAQTNIHALEPLKRSKHQSIRPFDLLDLPGQSSCVSRYSGNAWFISTQFENNSTFALGAISASFVFSSAGFGASKLTRCFEKPKLGEF